MSEPDFPKYVYKAPETQGWTPITLTKAEVRLLTRKWSSKPNWKKKMVFWDRSGRVGRELLVHHYMSPIAKGLSVVMYPIFVLMAGLSNINELHREYVGIFKERELGKFSADVIENYQEKLNPHPEFESAE